MGSRLYLPGIFWLGGMLLLFSAPIHDSVASFGVFSGRMILEFLVFMGFVHIWIATLKKQIRFEKIRRNAIWIIAIIAILLMFLMELGIVFAQNTGHLRGDSLIVNTAGIISGILTFKLLYRRCC